MRIFLIGFMGSGKSTIGNQLARQLGWQFVDSDKSITDQTGLSIPEIFSIYGEKWFRQKERELLQSFSAGENTVIATGGGMPCFSDNMDLMNRQGITVYLRIPPEILWERLQYGHKERPLLQNKSQEELSLYINETLEKREHFYMKAALIIDAGNKSAEHVVRLIMEGLGPILQGKNNHA